MIRINFCKTGASVSDWDIDEKVLYIKRIALLDKVTTYHFSNFLLLDALRAEIAEDKLSLDNITFSVDDKPLEVDKRGRCTSWPKEADVRDKILERLLNV